jgi:hypothetical protein
MNYTDITDSLTEPDTMFLSNRGIEVNGINSNSYISDYNSNTRSILLRTISIDNSLIPGNIFDNTTTGSVTVSSNSVIGSFTVTASGDISSGEITEDSPLTGGKVLTLTPTSTNSTFALTSDKISVKGNKWYKVNLLSKGASSRAIKFKFYDQNDNLLYESTESVSNKNITLDKWYQSPYSKIAKSPKGSSYMKVESKFISADNTQIETIKIGGIFIEEI